MWGTRVNAIFSPVKHESPPISAGFSLSFYFSNLSGNTMPTSPRFFRFGMCELEDFLCRRGLTRQERCCGLACAPAYGSEVRLFEPISIPRAEARGFYPEALCASFNLVFDCRTMS